MRLWFGDLLLMRGEFDVAEETLERSYFEARRAGSSATAFHAAVKLTELVGATRGRHAEGKRWAALADVERGEFSDPLDLAEATRVRALAGVHFAQGEFDTAKALYHRHLEIMRAAHGPDDPRLVRGLLDLGAVAIAQQMTGEAKPVLEHALAIIEATTGPDHPDLALCLNNLGVVHTVAKEFEAAEKAHTRALALLENTFGAEHPLVARTMASLGDVHAGAGRFAEAQREYEDALNKLDPRLSDSPDVAPIHLGLGDAYLQLGEHDQARRAYARAREIREKAYGADHPLLAAPLVGLAGVAQAVGDHEDAVTLGEQAMKLADAQSGDLLEARWITAQALWELGNDRPRAVALAQQVFDAASATGDEQAAKVETWLDERRIEGGAAEAR